MTRSELINMIKVELGYPLVNVELTSDMLNSAIDSSILAIKPYYSVTKYVTIDITSSCIDMVQYGLDIIEVTDVICTKNSSNTDASVSTSTTNSSTPSISNTNSYINMFGVHADLSRFNAMLRTGNHHKIISSYAMLHQRQFFDKLSTILEQRTNNMSGTSPSWRFYDDKLYISLGSSGATQATIEYITNIRDVDDIDDGDEDNGKFIDYLRQLAVAYASLIQSRVVGKHTVTGSPATVNADRMSKDAQTTIKAIKDELKKNTYSFYITT